MGPEDARLQDVRAWLAKAKLDLKAAEHEASAPAEKSMKAFLAWHDAPFRKRTASKTSEYAWRFRYPGEADEPEREEAELALESARGIYEAI